MEFQFPHYKNFQNKVVEIAHRFSLDPDNLKVEFYTPDSQAILIEHVEDQDFKIHINLQENRIISIQSLGNNGNGLSERLREKYRRYMK
ncbi:MAG: hypothetical protein ACE5IY_17565 [bacterium]